jgi:hypothetical protein
MLKDDQHFGYITNLEMEGKKKSSLVYITKLNLKKKTCVLGQMCCCGHVKYCLCHFH